MSLFYKRMSWEENHDAEQAAKKTELTRLNEIAVITVKVRDGDLTNGEYDVQIGLTEAMQALIDSSNIEWVWDSKFKCGGYFKPKD